MEMQAKAIARHVRMSPRKVRLVVDQIRGKSVNEAYALLQFSKKAAAEPVGKTLRSAVANAQVKSQVEGDMIDVDDHGDVARALADWRGTPLCASSPPAEGRAFVDIRFAHEEIVDVERGAAVL